MGLASLGRNLARRMLPEQLLEKRRARKRSADFLRAGVTFIHVPRSAGSSIADALYGKFIGHFTVQQMLEACPEDVLALPRFTVVRNPWDRLVSAYEFARAGGGTEGPHMVKISNPSRYRRAEYSDFATFVRAHVVGFDAQKLDGVFRPQMYYIRDDQGKLPFDFIGRFDQLETTEQWLGDTLHKRVKIPHFNVSQRDDYRRYYNEDTRDLVGRIYADTVETFGFEF
jgi:chondroitin 4-sulfotransferase 11